MDLRLRHRERVHMNMRGMINRMAYLNALHPRLSNNVVDQRTRLRVWLEHFANDRSARAGRQIVDRGRT